MSARAGIGLEYEFETTTFGKILFCGEREKGPARRKTALIELQVHLDKECSKKKVCPSMRLHHQESDQIRKKMRSH